LRAAQREEQLVLDGRWRDRRLGEMPFADFVEKVWLPSKHLELSTRAGYRSNNWPAGRIMRGWLDSATVPVTVGFVPPFQAVGTLQQRRVKLQTGRTHIRGPSEFSGAEAPNGLSCRSR
jgi:hypothetical protein